MRKGDGNMATACLTQHLQLVQQLGDVKGEINTWVKLAELAASEADKMAKLDDNANIDALIHDNEAWASEDRTVVVNRKQASERAIKYFEKAATLAKAHDEVSNALDTFGCERIARLLCCLDLPQTTTICATSQQNQDDAPPIIFSMYRDLYLFIMNCSRAGVLYVSPEY